MDITKYVAILLFSTCLSGNIRNWYRYLPEKIIKSWESFGNAFIKRWDAKKNTRIFTTKFMRLIRRIKNMLGVSTKGSMIS